MIAKIGIEKLSVMTVVGVFGYERDKKQELLIDLKVETDISLCAASDSFKDALDYVSLANVCERVANEHAFHLIEAYANAVIQAIKTEFSVSRIWIKILKPNALDNAVAAYIEIEQ